MAAFGNIDMDRRSRGLTLGRFATSGEQLTATGLALASAAAFFIFFYGLIYPIARNSLLGHGPFTQNSSAFLLGTRVNRTDQEAMWNALENADWSQPETYDAPDYRQICIDVLVSQDRKTAHQRLFALLDEKKSAVLERLSGDFVFEELLNQAGIKPTHA